MSLPKFSTGDRNLLGRFQPKELYQPVVYYCTFKPYNDNVRKNKRPPIFID
jgi:hypothetical protein